MLPEGSKHRILAVVDEMLTQLFSHTKTDSYARLFTISSPARNRALNSAIRIVIRLVDSLHSF